LDFTDASGLRALLLASQRAAAHSDRLRIIRHTGQVARVMRLTGVGRRLALLD
jgi:anti-anti-sigma regulatory factor